MGKRFGFVSFSDVIDARRTVGEMNDLWMGSYKLFVSVARFVDGEKEDRLKEDNTRKGKEKVNGIHANPKHGGAHQEKESNGEGILNMNFNGGGGRTFVDSLLNRNKIDVIRVDDNVEAFSQWYNRSVMGKVVDLRTLTELKTCLRAKEWKNVGIKYISGFTVLLLFNNVEDCDKFWLEKEEWANVFVKVDRWDGKQTVVDERIAWLQVHGAPVQLALDQVFDTVCSRYGEVVKPARMSTDDCNFLYVCIGVLCKTRGRIVDRVDISWRSVIYKVWIDEDIGEWAPECVEEIDGSVEEMEQDLEPDRNGHFSNENVNGYDVDWARLGVVKRMLMILCPMKGSSLMLSAVPRMRLKVTRRVFVRNLDVVLCLRIGGGEQLSRET
ncbi:putative RNA-binding domain superfamily [Helianthus debilis subsp. tardiflorus]